MFESGIVYQKNLSHRNIRGTTGPDVVSNIVYTVTTHRELTAVVSMKRKEDLSLLKRVVVLVPRDVERIRP